MKFSHLVVGGTFDYLHQGHKALLKTACQHGRQITIGLTSDKFVEDKVLSQTILPYSQRLKTLKTFLRKVIKNTSEVAEAQAKGTPRGGGIGGADSSKEMFFLKTTSKSIKILPLNNPYGQTLSNPTIDGLVVSPETLPGARLVNKKRRQLGLKRLKIIVCPFVCSSDGRHISSTRIRLGQVLPDGRLTKNFFTKNIKINRRQKKILKKPWGVQISNIRQLKAFIKKHRPTCLITIGDMTTKRFLDTDLRPDLCFVDFKIKRQKIKPFINSIQHSFSPTTADSPGVLLGDSPGVFAAESTPLKWNPPITQRLINPPGEIRHRLAEVIRKSLRDLFDPDLGSRLIYTRSGNGCFHRVGEEIQTPTRCRSRIVRSCINQSRKTSPHIVQILGEEDLAALPCSLLAPLNSLIFYGHANHLRAIKVTLELKKDLIKKLF